MVTDSNSFVLGGGTISISYCMYMALTISSGQKYSRNIVPERNAFKVDMVIERLK